MFKIRLLEIVMLLFVLFSLSVLFNNKLGRLRLVQYVPILSVIILIVHLFIEGVRWQFYPVYFIIILQSVTLVIRLRKGSSFISNKKRKRIVIVYTAISISLTAIFSYAFPVNKIPIPTGDNNIGTISFDVIDQKRKERYGGDLSDNRKIKLQIWYPAEKIDGYEVVPWLEDGRAIAEGVANMMGFPDFVLRHTSLIKSNSYSNAPISLFKEQYPVILLSHGWTGFRNIHTDVAELLASNGYIVVGIDHTYGSAVTVFNDGEVAYVNEDALPDREETPNFLDYANTLVSTFAGDIFATLAQLKELNEGEIHSQFKGKLDLSNIGIIGHSTGGGAAVKTALHDNRIKALIGMDAWVEPVEEKELEGGLNIPSLFLRSGEWEQGFNNENLFLLLNKSRSPVELYQINGTHHQDFSMIYMYSPLSKYFSITGKRDGREAATIQHDFILTFFEHHFNNQENNNVAKQYDDIQNIFSNKN
ncbi:alpha/beta hydrolase [Bacillus sp. 2205SS5-2]|uniref:alpha/beta hydrolase n=1 Tax=Bacillus sp. 2205SS5-2 TaxID=3109031 RepID=UPI0030056086